MKVSSSKAGARICRQKSQVSCTSLAAASPSQCRCVRAHAVLSSTAASLDVCWVAFQDTPLQSGPRMLSAGHLMRGRMAWIACD